MKIARASIAINCLLHWTILYLLLKWAFYGEGVIYFQPLTTLSAWIFYSMLAAGTAYTIYVTVLLVAFRRQGIKKASFWNIFLGGCVLLPLIGGYLFLDSSDQSKFDVLSVSNLTKIGLGLFLVSFGLLLRNRKIVDSFQN